MGTVVGTIKDAVDEMRTEGHRVGAVKMTTYRPFPAEALWEALKGAKRVAVLEKDISLGFTGAVASELRSAFYGRGGPAIGGYVVGLGGRDVGPDTIREIVEKMEGGEAPQVEFVDLRLENLEVME
jgi:pyruvate ferredoxin oxidoreductase alpha subunit